MRPPSSLNLSRATREGLLRLRAWLRPLLLTVVSAPLTVGGQAVIEGVMMRSPASFSVAVRRRDGSIVVREHKIYNAFSRYRVFRWPLVRGAVMLIESLLNGLTALNFAADQAMLDEKVAPSAATSLPPAAGALLTAGPSELQGSAKQSAALWGTLALSLVLGMALFVGLPHGLTYLLGLWVPGGLDLDSAGFHLIDGAFKMAIFLGYIWLISRLDDIKRLFMYHGAEHKSVHAFERGLPLEVAPTRPMSTAHPRCGTSLILWVVTISIFMFAAVFPWVPTLFEHALLNHVFAVLLKIVLSLPVAGIAYEVQRAAARHPDSRWVQVLIRPGMWLQALTTRPPGDAELEVALTALRSVLWRERQGATTVEDQRLERFTDFDEVVRQVA